MLRHSLELVPISIELCFRLRLAAEEGIHPHLLLGEPLCVGRNERGRLWRLETQTLMDRCEIKRGVGVDSLLRGFFLSCKNRKVTTGSFEQATYWRAITSTYGEEPICRRVSDATIARVQYNRHTRETRRRDIAWGLGAPGARPLCFRVF